MKTLENQDWPSGLPAKKKTKIQKHKIQTISNDENDNQTAQYKSLANQARISALGLLEVVQKSSKQFIDEMIDTGHQLDIEAKKNDKVDPLAEDAFIQKMRYVASGLRSELSTLRKEWHDEIVKRNNESSHQSDSIKGKKTIGEKTRLPLINRSKNLLKNMSQYRDEMLEKISDVRKELGNDIVEEGKNAELKWRQENHQRHLARMRSRQQLLGRFGWAEKNDIEELNRKITILAKLIATQAADSELTASIERRRTERRKKAVAQGYEKRLYSRRENDQQAA